jgi:MotA/TolQ/ExbB proton channel family
MNIIRNKMNIWWILACLNATALFWMWYFNVFAWIAAIDVTYITFVILAGYILSFLYVGWIVKKDPLDMEDELEPVWFTSEQLLGLGMLGTVIGFMIMLSTQFIGVSITDTQSVLKLIQTMSISMGTALVTTAAGLIASMVLKFKLVLFTKLSS